MRASSELLPSIENVSRETFSQLNAYAELLLKWNSKINLIGPATERDLWRRHIEDSLQLLPLIPEDAATLVDLGSGAGLPGLVIAIARPELKVTLVEQDQRKAAFLNEVRARLSLQNVLVEAVDIATLSGRYAVVTSRALAPLAGLFAFASALLAEGGICLFPKGVGAEKELEEAHRNWGFTYTQKSSSTLDGASIITVSKLTKIAQ